MKIFLDTNVLLDLALNRNDNHDAADNVVQSCVLKKNEGYITSHSICDFFYILRKDFSTELRMNWVTFLVNTFTILTEDKEAFQKSLKAECFDDLEDQLQIECASAAEVDYIITENLKDFEFSKVPVISSRDFATLR